jgi:hypothetical protein
MYRTLLARSGLVVALAANLLLAAMCFLSADGQKRIVAVEVRGESVQVRVDGVQVIPEPFAAQGQYVPFEFPETGSISIGVRSPVPSLGGTQGIESAVVRDGNGTVLFRDDFDSLDPGRWIVAGGFAVEDGVLVARQQSATNTVALRDTGWRDYTLEARFRNADHVELGVRRSGNGGLFYHANLIREYPGVVVPIREDGAQTGELWGGKIYPGKGGTVASLMATVAGSYPLPLLALAAAALVATALAVLEHMGARSFPGLAQQVQEGTIGAFIQKGQKVVWPAGVLAVALAAFAVTSYIMWHHYDHVPHTPDEASSLFQAKLFAAGRLTTAIPPVSEAFHVIEPNWLYERDGRWSTFYPLGYPLALVPGVALGAAWLVPPLLGGASVLLIGLIGRRLYGLTTGLVASLLLAASPFFLMQSSNFMSHIIWVFYVLMSMFFMLQRDRTPLFGALGGLFFGLAVNTRPLDAVMLAGPLGVALAWPLLRHETRYEAAGRCLGFLAGGAVAALLMLSSNAALTGDPLTPALQDWPVGGDPLHLTGLGFEHGHTLSIGLRDLQARVMALILVLNGWPAIVGLALVLLPFLLGSRNGWDYFCLACAVLIIVAYVLYGWAAAFYEGPRYAFQAVPFLMLLSARGAVMAAGLIGAAATRLRTELTGDLRPARWAGAAVVTPILLLLVADGTGGWLFGWNKAWLTADVQEIPNEVRDLHDYFGLNDRLQERAATMGIKANALVLVRNCNYGFHSCFDTVFNENSVDFNGDVVWAQYVPELNGRLIEAYPGRDVYVATWDPVSIVPYQPEPPLAGETQ